MSMKIPSPEECYQKYKEHLNLRMEKGTTYTKNSEVAKAFLEAGYQITNVGSPKRMLYKMTKENK